MNDAAMSPEERVEKARAELAEAERDAAARQGRDLEGQPTADVPPDSDAVSGETVPPADPGELPAEPGTSQEWSGEGQERKSLASLTDPDRDDAELAPVERVYVDHAAGRLNDHDAIRYLLALAAGCDDDVYADETPENA